LPYDIKITGVTTIRGDPVVALLSIVALRWRGGPYREYKVNMESYIVRIYRRDADNTQNFIGTVEQAGTEERKSFVDIDELWYIFNPLKRRQKKGKGSGLKRPNKRHTSP
jgi:hypothetical protein